MPQIGWFELLIVVLVAILVIGPKDFPVVLRKAGNFISSTKKYFSDASFFFFTNLLNAKKVESYSIFLKGFSLISETLLNLSMFSILKNWLSDFEELTPNKPKKERIKPR